MTDEQADKVLRAAGAHKTTDELADLAHDLAGKITPGPWYISPDGGVSSGSVAICRAKRISNGDAIAALPEFLAGIAELRRERDEAREAIRALFEAAEEHGGEIPQYHPAWAAAMDQVRAA